MQLGFVVPKEFKGAWMEQFNEAVAFAQSHEIPWPRDPATDVAHWGIHHDDRRHLTDCGAQCIRAVASQASFVCVARKSPPGANPIARTRRLA